MSTTPLVNPCMSNALAHLATMLPAKIGHPVCIWRPSVPRTTQMHPKRSIPASAFDGPAQHHHVCSVLFDVPGSNPPGSRTRRMRSTIRGRRSHSMHENYVSSCPRYERAKSCICCMDPLTVLELESPFSILSPSFALLPGSPCNVLLILIIVYSKTPGSKLLKGSTTASGNSDFHRLRVVQASLRLHHHHGHRLARPWPTSVRLPCRRP